MTVREYMKPNPDAAKPICLVSGGTGGHLMPALVLARAMAESGQPALVVTEGRDVERALLRRELPDVPAVELPRSGRRLGSLPLWLTRATWTARRLLREHDAAGVISTGGRASLPVALAARSIGIPLFLLEQNAVTGRANRWLLRLARRMYCGLPMVSDDVSGGAKSSRANKMTLTGTPLRTGFAHVDRADARRSLGLKQDVPVVLVTGGSQGAQVLNEVVPAALLRVPIGMQVLHLSGLGNDAAVRLCYADAATDASPQAAEEQAFGAHVRPVAADMDRLFAAADLVICRGGGTTVAELAAVGRAAIILPYPHHKDRQQLHNARVLERAGAAIIIEEASLESHALSELVSGLLRDPVRLREMGDCGRKLRRLDAAEAILADVQAAIHGGSTAMRELSKPGAAAPRSDLAPRSDRARRGGVA